MPGFILKTELKETDPDKQAAELSTFLNKVLNEINGIMVHPHPNDKEGKSEIKKERCGTGCGEGECYRYEYTPDSPFEINGG